MGKERRAVNPERVRQRFNREFKLEAVRLLELGEKPATQLAMELGIPRNRLYKWQKELSTKGPEAFQGTGRKPLEQQSEVARLKAELKRVTEERDILKKAAAYFAKELG
ncbi:transposase [Sideroxydans lithotrophicus]|uniref:Transposase IS3/IS911 family protein n=1 Tax=Sideroxydans lithotrophicus (strain ES-1) TaxID=580332 RepID=D5CLW9_SIDLE|nr:transposase [Sideroxydans lithotrophicus]ADE12564.1 transposase IS3/IS911 family protein [Sideroxydans lithotrophicus ES-1]ADE13012.1 transposase IS3/IS911 family protein [Sideroxydans lithotrophicus ES-1]